MFNDAIRQVFVYVALPVLGIICLMAVKAGKVGVLVTIILTAAVAAMFVFMSPGTAQALGSWMGNAVQQLLP